MILPPEYSLTEWAKTAKKFRGLLISMAILIVLVAALFVTSFGPNGPAQACLKNAPPGMKTYFKMPNQCIYVPEDPAP